MSDERLEAATDAHDYNAPAPSVAASSGDATNVVVKDARSDERLEAAARAQYQAERGPWQRKWEQLSRHEQGTRLYQMRLALAAADAHDTFEYGVRDRFGNTAGLRARDTWESFAEADVAETGWYTDAEGRMVDASDARFAAGTRRPTDTGAARARAMAAASRPERTEMAR